MMRLVRMGYIGSALGMAIAAGLRMMEYIMAGQVVGSIGAVLVVVGLCFLVALEME